MVWVRSASRKHIVIHASLERVRQCLLQIETCGRLMPTVAVLEHRGQGVYHYHLDEFSNGAVRFTPDYEARFDTSQPGQIRWEPHGEHNFRSWGVFRTEIGAVPGEVVLELETRAEAQVAIDTILIPLVEPFARESSDRVTEQFLAQIKKYVESPATLHAA